MIDPAKPDATKPALGKAYLNTEEAAAYLGIKERKLYELVANGAVPCSKVTGKWLFPRAALDRWIEAGLARPAGFDPVAPPPIVAGSHDPLLEWAVRRAGGGLALMSVGSGAGLDRLARNEVAIAAIHLHASGAVDANCEAVAAHHALADAVVIGFAQREAVLMVARENPLAITGISEAIAAGARFGQRQRGAGAQALLEVLLIEAGVAPASLKGPAAAYATGDDLAFALKAGEIDCGVATRAVATASGLSCVPLVMESFDLVMRRRTYFEPGAQALLALMRDPEFARHAALLGGLDVSRAGTVRLSR